MSDDVVEKLDWLAGIFAGRNQPHSYPFAHDVIQRARDEIVALRAERDIKDQFIDGLQQMVGTARAEALAKAAQVVEDYFNPETCGPCAAAIRALKDKP